MWLSSSTAEQNSIRYSVMINDKILNSVIVPGHTDDSSNNHNNNIDNIKMNNLKSIQTK